DDYRQIAADAVGPKTRLRLRVEREYVRRRTQRRIRIDDSRCEPLKQVRFFRVDLKMAHLDLRLRPGKSLLAFEDVWIVILVRQRVCFFARVGHDGAERTTDGLVRLNSHAASQTEHWIEYCAGGV